MEIFRIIGGWFKELNSWINTHIYVVNLVCGFWCLFYWVWQLVLILNGAEFSTLIHYLLAFNLGMGLLNFYTAWWIFQKRKGRTVRWNICKCGHERGNHSRYVKSPLFNWITLRYRYERCMVFEEADWSVRMLNKHFDGCDCEKYRRKILPTLWPLPTTKQNFVYNL